MVRKFLPWLLNATLLLAVVGVSAQQQRNVARAADLQSDGRPRCAERYFSPRFRAAAIS